MARRRSPARRRVPDGRQAAPLSTFSERIETGPDGWDYHVHPVPAARAEKTYRCPGCDHEIRRGTAHVVVLPTADGGYSQDTVVQDRRHWHTPCWSNRATRSPTRKWS